MLWTQLYPNPWWLAVSMNKEAITNLVPMKKVRKIYNLVLRGMHLSHIAVRHEKQKNFTTLIPWFTAPAGLCIVIAPAHGPHGQLRNRCNVAKAFFPLVISLSAPILSCSLEAL